MQVRRKSNGTILTLGSEIGTGGEARVYNVVNDSGLVAKIYHQSTIDRGNKLAAMLANPPEDPMAGKGHASIAWPVDLVEESGKSRVIGFLMPRITGMHSIINFYNPTLRRQRSPLFNYAYLHRTARNLIAVVRALHARGYVIGDVNQNNIMVTETALVTLVDTDSFQVRDLLKGTFHLCVVGTPAFTPSELQGIRFDQIKRTLEHDLFGLAVTIFHLLMEGVHPFAGDLVGSNAPPPLPEVAIANGYFPYATRHSISFQPMLSAPPYNVLHPKIQQMFLRCFEDGHGNPHARPDGTEWQNVIDEAEAALSVCSRNDQHRYGDHLKNCPWCERAAALGGLDPFPSRQAVKAGLHPQSSKYTQTPLPAAGIHAGTPTASSISPQKNPAATIISPTPPKTPAPKRLIWLPLLLLAVIGAYKLVHQIQPLSVNTIATGPSSRAGPDKLNFEAIGRLFNEL
ncbi:MAG: helix-hairpin-helix domain-containing protein, partial [Methylococcales bacterium]